MEGEGSGEGQNFHISAPIAEAGPSNELEQILKNKIEWSNRVVLLIDNKNPIKNTIPLIPSEAVYVPKDNPTEEDLDKLNRLTVDYATRRDHQEVLLEAQDEKVFVVAPPKPDFDPLADDIKLKYFLISNFTDPELVKLGTQVYSNFINEKTGNTITSHARSLIGVGERHPEVRSQLISILASRQTTPNTVTPPTAQ
jgi:hypothetical protein